MFLNSFKEMTQSIWLWPINDEEEVIQVKPSTGASHLKEHGICWFLFSFSQIIFYVNHVLTVKYRTLASPEYVLIVFTELPKL